MYSFNQVISTVREPITKELSLPKQGKNNNETVKKKLNK
jgi:hypothetical protein